MSFEVVLDTCALYPAHLRDTLLRLAERGLYRASLPAHHSSRSCRRDLTQGILAAAHRPTQRGVDMLNDPTSQVESNHAIYLERYKAEAERHHEGEVALMVDGEIKEYFPTASDAYAAGYDQYGLGNFSIQQIGADPIGLGAQTLALL